VSTLLGTYIKCPDGSQHGPLRDGTGYTFFYGQEDKTFCDVILPTSLCELPFEGRVATVLHELAHVKDYSIHGANMIGISEQKLEEDAWHQASTWAITGGLDSEESLKIASLCLKLSESEGV
jgi:hypothetical protein